MVIIKFNSGSFIVAYVYFWHKYLIYGVPQLIVQSFAIHMTIGQKNITKYLVFSVSHILLTLQKMRLCIFDDF
jgi:hypothetical protein